MDITLQFDSNTVNSLASQGFQSGTHSDDYHETRDLDYYLYREYLTRELDMRRNTMIGSGGVCSDNYALGPDASNAFKAGSLCSMNFNGADSTQYTSNTSVQQAQAEDKKAIDAALALINLGNARRPVEAEAGAILTLVQMWKVRLEQDRVRIWGISDGVKEMNISEEDIYMSDLDPLTESESEASFVARS